MVFLQISWQFLMTNKMFIALGNDRPQILVRLEDHVLQAIIRVLEGNLRDYVMATLYSEITSLEKDLADDDKAMNWFNFAIASSPIPLANTTLEFPSKPMAALPNLATDMFRGWCCISNLDSNLIFFLHDSRAGVPSRLTQ
jgi:hypothetical protein